MLSLSSADFGDPQEIDQRVTQPRLAQQGILDQRAVRLLARNPHLANSLPLLLVQQPLLRRHLLAPVFMADQRCGSAEYYIQAVIQGGVQFLSSNVTGRSRISVTANGQCWLLGRSVSCAFTLPLASISRFHAAIGCCRDRGLYIVDLGSRNGTFINQRRIPRLRKYFLREGDVIQLSHLQFRVLIAASDAAWGIEEKTQVLEPSPKAA
jgi:hypothetical protein